MSLSRIFKVRTVELLGDNYLCSQKRIRLRDRNYSCSSPDPFNFDLADAESKEIA